MITALHTLVCSDDATRDLEACHVGHRPDSVSAAEGVRAADDGRGVIYWRKGCPFTKRLRLVLGKRGAQAVWAEICADPGRGRNLPRAACQAASECL